MIKHIVSWKINKTEDKDSVAVEIKTRLENLKGEIDGILELEVGIDYSKTDMSADIVLYSVFNSKESLEKYQVHPLHQEVGKFIKARTNSRTLVDYEV